MDAAYLCSIQHRLNHYGLHLLHTRTNEKRSNKNGAVNKFLKMDAAGRIEQQRTNGV